MGSAASKSRASPKAPIIKVQASPAVLRSAAQPGSHLSTTMWGDQPSSHPNSTFASSNIETTRQSNTEASVVTSSSKASQQKASMASQSSASFSSSSTMQESTNLPLRVIPSADELVAAIRQECAIQDALTFVVLGASGDLAKKKIYPVLWSLYRDAYIQPTTAIIGYARSSLTHETLIKQLRPYLKVAPGEEETFQKFCDSLQYISGTYDDEASFRKLNEFITAEEQRTTQCPEPHSNRVFYLALPPQVFDSVTLHLNNTCRAKTGWNRFIIEKPFGRDSDTCEALNRHLRKFFVEDELYRIDHYLGKEMLQCMPVLRFGNRLFSPIWNRDSIACVQISFKEDFGCQGRGGYFDEYGIVRDVMQNHLVQIMCKVAMERPATRSAHDIRNEKVKVLRAIEPMKADDIILGQYVASNIPGKEESKQGYQDDPTVPKGSQCPTFAVAVLRINTERWDGVPFILRCGKALNERKAEIRIQFRDVAGMLFPGGERNEMVIRIQPNEAIYLKCLTKKPGLSFDTFQTDLDLSYMSKYKGLQVPDAYERLILDVFHGQQHHFVRDDELTEAWRIFTPVLKEIDAGKIKTIPYPFGSRGPKEADEFIAQLGYKRQPYDWPDAQEGQPFARNKNL